MSMPVPPARRPMPAAAPHRRGWSATPFVATFLAASLALGCDKLDATDPADLSDDEVSTDATADTRPDDGTDDDVSSPPPRGFDAGSARLEVGVDPLRIELARGDASLLTIEGPGGLQVGWVDAFDESAFYDPFPLYADGLNSVLFPDPPLDGWLELARATWRDDEAVLALRFEDPDAPARFVTGTLEIAAIDDGQSAGGRFSLALRLDDDPAVAPAYLRYRTTIDDEEGIYGFGENFDSPESRGRIRTMQLNVDNLDSGFNEVHVPIPFAIGTRGWGMFVDSAFPATFDVAQAEPDVIDATFAPGPEWRAGLDIHLFAEAHPLDVTRHYHALTGAPGDVAPWALGPWIWRDENDDQAQVIDDVNTIRDLDLATTGYWIDRPYASGVNTFDFESALFPDPEAMVAEIHRLGMRFALWHTPYLDPDDPDVAALRAEAEAAGYFPPESGLQLNPWGEPLDVTNPDATAWWQARLAGYRDLGVEGYKLDYAEDVVPGSVGLRLPWRFDDGSTDRTMHARYQPLYHAMYREMLPADGGFLLCRGGAAGDQALGVIVWPGDLEATFDRHRETVIDEDGAERVAVGGLPAALSGGLSLGPTGFPLYGSDTGGYRLAPPDKELYMRWMQVSALGTVMQVGTNTNDVPWELGGENGFDQEVLDTYRRYARLHLRLFPTLWTLWREAQTTGRAIARPLGFAHPELGIHPADTYLLGPDLFVAPVVTRDARERTFTLPTGEWVGFFDGSRLEGSAGGETHTVAAPLDHLPLYLRSGGTVTLLRPTIDTLAPTEAPMRADSFATRTGALHAIVVAGGAGETVVYDGTRLVHDVDGGLSVTPGSVFDEGVVFEVIAADAPTRVVFDGVAMPTSASRDALLMLADDEAGWFYDPSERGGVVWVKLPAGASSADVDIDIDG